MKSIIQDGSGINSDHFGAMTETEAIKRMIADGFVPGADEAAQTTWAKDAYGKIKAEQKKIADAEAKKLADAEAAKAGAAKAKEPAPLK